MSPTSRVLFFTVAPVLRRWGKSRGSALQLVLHPSMQQAAKTDAGRGKHSCQPDRVLTQAGSCSSKSCSPGKPWL